MAGLDGGGGETYDGDPDDVEDIDDDDGGGGGGGGDGGGGSIIPDFSDIAPGFLTNNLNVLEAFLKNPRNFIIGAIATTLLEQVFGIVTTILNVIFLVLGGSAPGRLNAPGETLGLIDVPVFVADLLAGIGTDVGIAVVQAIDSLNDPVFALASNAGPATPVIITAIVVGEVIVVLWLLQRLVFVVADLLQLGGLTE